MSDLGWRADGIARAKAAGGIELEPYRKPGFASGTGVRRSDVSLGGSGVSFDWQDSDPWPDEYEDLKRG